MHPACLPFPLSFFLHFLRDSFGNSGAVTQIYTFVLDVKIFAFSSSAFLLQQSVPFRDTSDTTSLSLSLPPSLIIEAFSRSPSDPWGEEEKETGKIA